MPTVVTLIPPFVFLFIAYLRCLLALSMNVPLAPDAHIMELMYAKTFRYTPTAIGIYLDSSWMTNFAIDLLPEANFYVCPPSNLFIFSRFYLPSIAPVVIQ
jgi:hypothetical protein